MPDPHYVPTAQKGKFPHFCRPKNAETFPTGLSKTVETFLQDFFRNLPTFEYKDKQQLHTALTECNPIHKVLHKTHEKLNIKKLFYRCILIRKCYASAKHVAYFEPHAPNKFIKYPLIFTF